MSSVMQLWFCRFHGPFRSYDCSVMNHPGDFLGICYVVERAAIEHQQIGLHCCYIRLKGSTSITTEVAGHFSRAAYSCSFFNVARSTARFEAFSSN